MSRPTCATCPVWLARKDRQNPYGVIRRYCKVEGVHMTADETCTAHPDMPAWIAAKKEPTDG